MQNLNHGVKSTSREDEGDSSYADINLKSHNQRLTSVAANHLTAVTARGIVIKMLDEFKRTLAGLSDPPKFDPVMIRLL